MTFTYIDFLISIVLQIYLNFAKLYDKPEIKQLKNLQISLLKPIQIDLSQAESITIVTI